MKGGYGRGRDGSGFCVGSSGAVTRCDSSLVVATCGRLKASYSFGIGARAGAFSSKGALGCGGLTMKGIIIYSGSGGVL